MTEIEEKFLNANNELFRVLAEFGMTVVETNPHQPRVHSSYDHESEGSLDGAFVLPMDEINFSCLDDMLIKAHGLAKKFVGNLPQIQRMNHQRFCFVGPIHTVEFEQHPFSRTILFLDIA
jgi:hypothetical protein